MDMRPTISQVKEDLFEHFGHIGHHLSPEHMKAIELLIETMARCYFGKAKDNSKAYLSSLAPGIGKSSTLKAFLKQVAKYDDGRGCLVCLGTVDEIVDFCTDLDPETLNIWVNKLDEERVQNLYKRECSDAKILVTTHKRLELEFTTKNSTRKLSELTNLKYQGSVRSLRVWDEAFLPGQVVTLALDNLHTLAGSLKSFDMKLGQQIEGLIESAQKITEQHPTGQLAVPALFQNTCLEDAIESIDSQRGILRSEQFKELLAALHGCSGKTVAVRKSTNGKASIVTFKPTINPSFNPLVILDASGRKGYRKTYDEMVKRDRIIRLDEEDKLYQGFEIDVWNTGGGKDSFRKEWDALVSGVARWINELPEGDRCLVIHHLPDPPKSRFKAAFHMQNFEEGLKEFMVSEYPFFEQDRLGFTTWGKHRARNTWADYGAVVAAGSLFKPDAVYESQHRIAKAQRPENGLVDASTLLDFRLGETCDDLVQGLGRIRIRGIDPKNPKSAPPAKALVVAAHRSIPFDCYSAWFPGATVRDWGDVKKVRGKAAEYLGPLVEWATGKPHGSRLLDREAWQLLEMERRDYHNRVVRSASLATKLKTSGMVRVKGGWQYTKSPQGTDEELQVEHELAA